MWTNYAQKLKVLLLFMSFLWTNLILCQDTLQLSSVASLYNLDKNTAYYVDSSGTLDLETAINLLDSKPNSLIDHPEVFQCPYCVYWFHVQLAGPEKDTDWRLVFKNPIYKDFEERNEYTAENLYVDLFVVSEGVVIEQVRDGVFVPKSERNIYANPLMNVVDFKIPAGEVVQIYVKINNLHRNDFNISLELRSSDIPLPILTTSSEIMSIIIGIGMLVCLLSLLIFIANKEWAYLFFAGFCLCLFLHWMLLHGDALFIRWIIPEHPWLAIYFFYFCATGSTFFFVLFGYEFVNLKDRAPRLGRIMLGIAGFIVLTFIAIIIDKALSLDLRLEILFGVIFLSTVVVSLFIGRFPGYSAKIFLAGALCLLVFNFLGLLFNAGYFTFFNPWPVGQVGIMLIFLMGLAYKIKLDERLKATQKQKLQDAQIIEKAYADLQQAQKQLVQAEKMASLGQLTAGIAHEIQNPLNFVNNFSEVSSDLIDEMVEEIERGELDEAKSISDSLKENLQKITHHGKRADSIVKGMLLHSRSSSDTKELVDINAMADEYLRLAYHGMRAKQKSFNATFQSEFDPALPKISVSKQDLGRVLLNIITNAFHAVHEKSKDAEATYSPTVVIKTEDLADSVKITVQDNGLGIPPELHDKIFQPFFTTKSAGEGTGLGLSISYDIVTKGHGGNLEVESTVGEGSRFVITIPK